MFLFCRCFTRGCTCPQWAMPSPKRLKLSWLLPAWSFIEFSIVPLEVGLKSGRAAWGAPDDSEELSPSRLVLTGAAQRIMWSVFFVFLSYLDRDVVRGNFLSQALDAEKENKEMFSMVDGSFCAKMSLVGQNLLYQVSDGAEVVRTVVTPAGQLVNCSVTVNQEQVKSFVHECRLGLKEQGAAGQLETRFTSVDEAKATCLELEGRPGLGGNQQHQGLRRSKRGFTYPGTLWCGAGNMADDYSQLGEFGDTDSCCRIHDHCPHVIHAFSSNYGYTNFKWHSISHCDCDEALKACLRKVNDTSSRVVGQAFFNVLGVPCFEFGYEEQCVERHWYGLCKKYEKLPVAVLRESVPYDYGGIEVIDELTLAPPKSKDSKKNEEEEEKQESSTQSTVLGHEEASLRNVVTAAEDFIKVLATVSTSQSSTADSDKGEAETSEKKKRKNTGKKKKKTNKKPKEKGKGRKRKQKAAAGVKTEDGAAVSPAGSKAEEILALSNFISETKRREQSAIDSNRVEDGDYELRGEDEPANEVMKDEPAVQKEATTPPSTGREQPEELDTDVLKEQIPPSASKTTVVPLETRTRRQRKGRRRKIEKNPPPLSEEEITADNVAVVSAPSTTFLPQTQLHGITEHQPAVTVVTPKLKRDRSKERGDRAGRKKRRKLTCASLIVCAERRQKSSVDVLKVIPHTGISTEQQQQLPRQSHHQRAAAAATPLSSTFSVLKRQRLKERGLRNRRRNTALLPLSDSAGFSHMPAALTTPNARVARIHPEAQSEWRLFTTAAPTVGTKLGWQPTRKASREPAEQTEQETPATSRLNAATVGEPTSAAPSVSPRQLSLQKAEAQYNRKKRRKAARSNGQKCCRRVADVEGIV